MPLQLKSAIKFTCKTEINYPERRKFIMSLYMFACVSFASILEKNEMKLKL